MAEAGAAARVLSSVLPADARWCFTKAKANTERATDSAARAAPITYRTTSSSAMRIDGAFPLKRFWSETRA